MKTKLTIKQKLICIILVLIIYPILLIGYIGYKNYASTTRNTVLQYSEQSVSELSDLLGERVQKLNVFAQEMLYDDNIYTYYNRLQLQRQSDDLLEEYTFKENFERYLSSILHSKTELNAVFFYFKENDQTYTADRNFSDYSPPKPLVANIYSSAKREKGKPIWFFNQEDDDNYSIYLIKMVYDIHSRKEIGVWAYNVDEKHLFEPFKKFALDKNQNISIYNDNFINLFTFNSFDQYGPIDIKQLFKDKDKGICQIDDKDDEFYIIYHTIEPLNWRITATISSNILLDEVRKIAKKTALLCVLTLPLWALILYIMYSDIVRPTKVLIENMKMVEQGHIGRTIDIERQDELGFIFTSFNKMSLEIANLIDSVYKKQIVLKDAHIKALQSQINPHFLYNTLETISWRAKLANLDEISQMIEAFTCLIDASMNRENEREISLREEIDYIDNYIFLIEKRFGDKIAIKKRIDPETLDFIIPKLAIQPFIENAVYHGLEQKKGKGYILLSSNIKNSNLIIDIDDNGLGIDEEKLRELHNMLKQDNYVDRDEMESHTQIGMINVHRRIRLMYGRQYGITLTSKQGEGTGVRILLPLKKGKKEERGVDIVQHSSY